MEKTYLDTIIVSHRRRTSLDSRKWRDRAEEIHVEGPSFLTTLRQGASPYLKVLAEIKRRSPSKGWFDADLDAASLARIYRDNDAAGVSVLTDHDFFGGSLDDLRAVRRAIALPLLRKDFILSENDVLDAVEAGANAVLLIVAVLSDRELSRYLDVAHNAGADALVEVHDAQQARRAIDAGARIVGVNQRNLHTFEINTHHAGEVVATLPRECISVCESGLATLEDVERAAQAGFDAVLVGEALVTSPDPGATLKSFSLVASVQRG